MLARWSDTTPPTWTSAGFTPAAYGDPLAWDGAEVTPVVVSRGDGPLDVPTGWIGLAQPGEASVTLGDTLDAADLAPGLWDVVTTDGTAPRSLLVGEVDDHVSIDAVVANAGTVRIDGAGFGRGTEAWGIGGPVRAMHALDPVEATDTELVFDWVPGDDTLLAWSNGAWVGAVGMGATPEWDEDPPATVVITGEAVEPGAVGYLAGGCGGHGGLSLVGVFGLGARRISRGPSPPARRSNTRR